MNFDLNLNLNLNANNTNFVNVGAPFTNNYNYELQLPSINTTNIDTTPTKHNSTEKDTICNNNDDHQHHQHIANSNDNENDVYVSMSGNANNATAYTYNYEFDLYSNCNNNNNNNNLNLDLFSKYEKESGLDVDESCFGNNINNIQTKEIEQYMLGNLDLDVDIDNMGYEYHNNNNCYDMYQNPYFNNNYMVKQNNKSNNCIDYMIGDNNTLGSNPNNDNPSTLSANNNEIYLNKQFFIEDVLNSNSNNSNNSNSVFSGSFASNGPSDNLLVLGPNANNEANGYLYTINNNNPSSQIINNNQQNNSMDIINYELIEAIQPKPTKSNLNVISSSAVKSKHKQRQNKLPSHLLLTIDQRHSLNSMSFDKVYLQTLDESVHFLTSNNLMHLQLKSSLNKWRIRNTRKRNQLITNLYQCCCGSDVKQFHGTKGIRKNKQKFNNYKCLAFVEVCRFKSNLNLVCWFRGYLVHNNECVNAMPLNNSLIVNNPNNVNNV